MQSGNSCVLILNYPAQQEHFIVLKKNKTCSVHRRSRRN